VSRFVHSVLINIFRLIMTEEGLKPYREIPIFGRIAIIQAFKAPGEVSTVVYTFNFNYFAEERFIAYSHLQISIGHSGLRPKRRSLHSSFRKCCGSSCKASGNRNSCEHSQNGGKLNLRTNLWLISQISAHCAPSLRRPVENCPMVGRQGSHML
jgi:hypothetical protein